MKAGNEQVRNLNLLIQFDVFGLGRELSPESKEHNMAIIRDTLMLANERPLSGSQRVNALIPPSPFLLRADSSARVCCRLISCRLSIRKFAHAQTTCANIFRRFSTNAPTILRHRS